MHPRRGPALVAIAGLLSACLAGPSPSAAESATARSARSAPEAPEPAPSPSPAPVETPIGASPALAVELVVDGLETPIGVTHAGDGSESLFVNEQDGRIIVVAPDGGTSLYLDVRERITGGGERGLLGLAFHPDYIANGRLFVNYTRAGDGATVVAEFGAARDRRTAGPASERILLTVAQPYPNHNGGQLAFGPDGYLYIGLGDGGAGGDPHGNGQNPATLLGKILRIDVDPAPSAGQAYVIPPDNPFVGGGGAPEVWAYGLRNPWRFSFDRQTGDLWIGDVGQGSFEEIDRQPGGSGGGENYGWAVMEGSHCFAPTDCDPALYVGPVTEYPLTGGNRAVIGGFVYRGQGQPQLVGRYVFGDYGSGRIWAVPAGATPAPGEIVPPELVLDSELVIGSFGEDADGELYVTDITGGALYRLVVDPGST